MAGAYLPPPFPLRADGDARRVRDSRAGRLRWERAPGATPLAPSGPGVAVSGRCSFRHRPHPPDAGSHPGTPAMAKKKRIAPAAESPAAKAPELIKGEEA